MTRKADIRNFLCSILVDDILKLEGNKKYLSPDIFSPKNFEDNDYKDKNEGDESNHNLLLKYTISQKFDTKLILKLNSNEENNLTRTSTKRDKGHNENKETGKEIQKDNNDFDNNIFDPLLLLENCSSYDIKGITLDQFFDKNNTVSEFINKKLSEFLHYSKTNPVNLAMIDYLNCLKR